ncbi:hypothetical protein C7N43_06305 [Sphingobacteriales bacterium UPWRP_1]|nr:hypothetical protein BVG80_11980 [Sphingobacteriales bacterium TSM_CSM]PSJ77941.1 hypothetical protein C7N43_06305 [Sphingobacteriales bacterium UPWRP_1]
METKREAIRLFPEELGDVFYGTSGVKNVEIYVDEKNCVELLSVLKKQDKRTKRILYEILRDAYNNDLYRKEAISDKAKDITAMKFTNSPNRIYCKEFHFENNKKIVVLIRTHNKKSEKIDKKTRNIIESIAEYEYNFEEY